MGGGQWGWIQSRRRIIPGRFRTAPLRSRLSNGCVAPQGLLFVPSAAGPRLLLKPVLPGGPQVVSVAAAERGYRRVSSRTRQGNLPHQPRCHSGENDRYEIRRFSALHHCRGGAARFGRYLLRGCSTGQRFRCRHQRDHPMEIFGQGFHDLAPTGRSRFSALGFRLARIFAACGFRRRGPSHRHRSLWRRCASPH